MNKPVKNILILRVVTVLLISVFPFLLAGCNSADSIEQGYIQDTVKEKDIRDNDEQKNVNVLESYVSNGNIILLYENDNQYVVDYCYRNREDNSINSISRYSFKANNTGDKIVFKCFGTENEDFVIIIFKNDEIFNNTKRIHIKLEDIEFDHVIDSDSKEMIIKFPERPDKLRDPAIILYDNDGNEVDYK